MTLFYLSPSLTSKCACLFALELVAILLYMLVWEGPGYLVTPFSLSQALLIMHFLLIHDLLSEVSSPLLKWTEGSLRIISDDFPPWYLDTFSKVVTSRDHLSLLCSFKLRTSSSHIPMNFVNLFHFHPQGSQYERSITYHDSNQLADQNLNLQYKPSLLLIPPKRDIPPALT